VIFHQREENQRRFSSYLEQAKELERKLENQPWGRTREDSRVFWSIAYGILPITSLYEKKMAELKTELLLTGFLNERSLKVAPLAKRLYQNISALLNRGIQIKYLWSFECDERPLSKAELQTVQIIFSRLRIALREWMELPNSNFFQMRYVTKRIPTYYDIFDEKRVLVKMQNPLDATQIFACINILDPTLALGLRARFLNLWTYEAHE
jgi:hypothetical protein